jgi:hypothetical protein
MPKKKAPEPKEPEEEKGVPVEEEAEDEGGEMMDKESMQHLIKGATEIMLAMERMVPKKQMPPEVKVHAKAAKREVLLMFRALLDVKIKECDEKESAPETKLKKINLD